MASGLSTADFLGIQAPSRCQVLGSRDRQNRDRECTFLVQDRHEEQESQDCRRREAAIGSLAYNYQLHRTQGLDASIFLLKSICRR